MCNSKLERIVVIHYNVHGLGQVNCKGFTFSSNVTCANTINGEIEISVLGDIHAEINSHCSRRVGDIFVYFNFSSVIDKQCRCCVSTFKVCRIKMQTSTILNRNLRILFNRYFSCPMQLSSISNDDFTIEITTVPRNGIIDCCCLSLIRR